MAIRIRAFWPLLAPIAFLALLSLVLADWEPIRQVDLSLSERFRGYGKASPGTVEVIRVVTDVMGTYAFMTIGLAAAVLFGRAHRRSALLCLAVTVTVPVLWAVMHVALHRPRPVSDFVEIDSNGFPSGHTAHATATALTATLLLWPRLGRAGRAAAVALGVALAGGIGLTRVALLAHWPTDVLGGWLLALAAVPLLARLVRRVPTDGDRPGDASPGDASAGGTGQRAGVVRSGAGPDRSRFIRCSPAAIPGRGWPPVPGCAGRAWPGSG